MDTHSFIRKAIQLMPHGPNALAASLNSGTYAGLNVSASFHHVKYVEPPVQGYNGSLLPRNWWFEYKAATANVDSTGRPVGTVFTIWSYNTPIAWYDENRNEWVVPNVFMSATTARHQAYVRQELSARYRRPEFKARPYREEPIVPANYRDERGYVIRDLVEYDEAGKIK